jgi:hypothetical protein
MRVLRWVVPVVLVAGGIALGTGSASAYTTTIYEGPYPTLADCQLDRNSDVHAEGSCIYAQHNPKNPTSGVPGYYYPTLI